VLQAIEEWERKEAASVAESGSFQEVSTGLTDRRSIGR
jgi:hypothetical protein